MFHSTFLAAGTLLTLLSSAVTANPVLTSWQNSGCGGAQFYNFGTSVNRGVCINTTHNPLPLSMHASASPGAVGSCYLQVWHSPNCDESIYSKKYYYVSNGAPSGQCATWTTPFGGPFYTIGSFQWQCDN